MNKIRDAYLIPVAAVLLSFGAYLAFDIFLFPDTTAYAVAIPIGLFIPTALTTIYLYATGRMTFEAQPVE